MTSTLVYDPYLSSLGGGERYAFALATAAAVDGPVTVAGPVAPTASVLADMGFPPVAVARMPSWRYQTASRRYDRVIRIANHLPPAAPLPGRSWLVVQFPFTTFARRHPTRSILRSHLLSGYRCIVYSEFVRRHLGARWGVDAEVLAPPVEQGEYMETAKEPLILAVGRFFVGEHTKRHDILIEAYRLLPPAVRSTWSLILAGGADESSATADYLSELGARAAGLNVTFAVNAPASELSLLYRRAGLFWHAAGYGRPLDAPERAEHFGITTVEAMSWGAVPLGYRDGGTAETITCESGVLWENPEELAAATVQLVYDPERRRAMAAAGAMAAATWRPEVFLRRAHQLLVS